jgi:uncharacterized protein YbaR (Trm112 family)
MHIELIDLLRCPKDHEETWLVAALSAVQDRFVIKGKLGCPVCGASYSISKGVADLQILPGDHSVSHIELNSDEAVRVAALLNLTRPGSVAVLEGDYAGLSQAVSEMTDCKIIAVNPRKPVEDSESVAIVLCDAKIPLASDSVIGAVCASAELIQDVPRILRNGARALLPVDCVIPAGLVEVTRDDRNILAESVGAIVELRR